MASRAENPVSGPAEALSVPVFAGFSRTDTGGSASSAAQRAAPSVSPRSRRTRSTNFAGSVMRYSLALSASRRAQIRSSTAGFETKSSWSLSTTSTSPS